MIIWRGWGILALLILGAGGGGGTGIGIALGGARSGGNWGTVVGFLLAAAALWLVGTALNKPKSTMDPATGETTVHRNRHTLFWVPIQFLAPFAALVAVVVGVVLVVG